MVDEVVNLPSNDNIDFITSEKASSKRPVQHKPDTNVNENKMSNRHRPSELPYRRQQPSLAFAAARRMWKPPWPHLLLYPSRSVESSNDCSVKLFNHRRSLFSNSANPLKLFGTLFVLISSLCYLPSASSTTHPTHYSSVPDSTTVTLPANTQEQPQSIVTTEDVPEVAYDPFEADPTAYSESRLHSLLMTNYSKDARPAKVSNVSVHLQLISLDDVQESGNLILTVQIWMTWRDLRFRWSPSNYSGVVSLQILPVERIWFPLFWIRNSAQPDIQSSFWSDFPAFIGWSGIVSWVSSGKVTVACHLDFFYYPSDSQTCSIQFSAHDSYHVNFMSHDEKRPICFDRYTNNSLWELRLRRRPLTDILRMFLPTVCLAVVSLIAFLLPPDSGDKLNVTFTTMLAFFVMFLAITDMVPFTAEHTPIMTYFVVSTLLLSTIETILCAVIMTISETEKARQHAAHQNEMSKKSSKLVRHLENSASVATLLSKPERRGSLGYAWSGHLELANAGCYPDDDVGPLEDIRPRSYSNSTTCSSVTDTGIIDLSGADPAILSALKSKQQQRRRSSTAVLINKTGVDGASFQPRSIRRKIAMFVIGIAQRIVSVFRKNEPCDNDSNDSVKLVQGIITSKRLNIISFFIFGAIKIVLISLVSVTLYDQSRHDDIAEDGFHAPEYANCWQ